MQLESFGQNIDGVIPGGLIGRTDYLHDVCVDACGKAQNHIGDAVGVEALPQRGVLEVQQRAEVGLGGEKEVRADRPDPVRAEPYLRRGLFPGDVQDRARPGGRPRLGGPYPVMPTMGAFSAIEPVEPKNGNVGG